LIAARKFADLLRKMPSMLMLLPVKGVIKSNHTKLNQKLMRQQMDTIETKIKGKENYNKNKNILSTYLKITVN
jgi:stalled ribosome alternative rescue factor ArfA